MTLLLQVLYAPHLRLSVWEFLQLPLHCLWIQKHPTGKRNLQDVKDYIDMHFTEKIMLDDLSERFFINKYYLTRIFREQFGMPISQYIMQLRITHAKRNLRFTTLSMEEIAVECGLEDANYFSRVFRKVEGVSPGEYRKQW